MSELTVFERDWNNSDVPKLFISEWYGVMTLPDPFPRLPYQTLVVPERRFRENEKVIGDMPARERHMIAALTCAVQRRLQNICKGDQLAITHTEGYGQPLHGHTLVYQSPERKSGRALYDGPTIDWDQDRTLKTLTISPGMPDYDSLNRELDAVDKAFPNRS